MTKAGRSRRRASSAKPPTPSPVDAAPAGIAYVPFEVDDFVETRAGHWRAAAAPLPSDSVERIEISITLKPGVRLRNVGRSCAHAAVDVTRPEKA